MWGRELDWTEDVVQWPVRVISALNVRFAQKVENYQLKDHQFFKENSALRRS